MADNNIPQALGYLTDYLKGENTRLEKEKDKNVLNQTLIDASSKFKQLGTDATPEQARNLMFDITTNAAKIGADNAIPFIQSLYGDVLKTITTQQQEMKDKATSKWIGDLTGQQVPVGVDPGEAMKALTYYQNTFQEEKGQNKEGYGTVQLKQFKGKEGYVPVGPVRVIDSFGPKEQNVLDIEKNKQIIKAQLMNGNGRSAAYNQAEKETPYTIDYKGTTVALQRTGKGFNFYYGGQWINYDPAIHGAIGKYQDSSIVASRDERTARKYVEDEHRELESYGNSLARSLVNGGAFGTSQDELDIKKNIWDVDKTEPQKNTGGYLIGWARTKANYNYKDNQGTDQTAQSDYLRARIEKITNPDIKATALFDYEKYMEHLRLYELRVTEHGNMQKSSNPSPTVSDTTKTKTTNKPENGIGKWVDENGDKHNTVDIPNVDIYGYDKDTYISNYHNMQNFLNDGNHIGLQGVVYALIKGIDSKNVNMEEAKTITSEDFNKLTHPQRISLMKIFMRR